MFYRIKVGSVTNAQRALSVLRKNGYKANITRIEKPEAGDGCGYVIRISPSVAKGAVEVLERNGVKILGVEQI